MPNTDPRTMVETQPADVGSVPPIVSEEPDEPTSPVVEDDSTTVAVPSGEGEETAASPDDGGQPETTEPESTEPAPSLDDVQRQLQESEQRIERLDRQVEGGRKAYRQWQSQTRSSLSEMQRVISESQEQDAQLAAMLKEQQSDSDAWAEIVLDPVKYNKWLETRDALSSRAQWRERATAELNERIQTFNESSAEEYARQAAITEDRIRSVANKAGWTDAQWEAFLNENGRLKDANGNVIRGAFHRFGDDWDQIEKAATDIIKGRHAPKAIEKAIRQTERTVEAREAAKRAKMLPGSGTVQVAGGKSEGDDFIDRIVNFDPNSVPFNDLDE